MTPVLILMQVLWKLLKNLDLPHPYVFERYVVRDDYLKTAF
jgi:hypothetical protein